MVNKLTAVQLDIDVMCDSGSHSYEDLEYYITERLDGLNCNLVYLQVACEGYWHTKAPEDDRMSNWLLFDPGERLDAKVLDATVLTDAIAIIKAHYPDMKIAAWAPTLYNEFLFRIPGADACSHDGSRSWYKRASAFSDYVKNRLNTFFFILGELSPHWDGVLFQDDMFYEITEDTSLSGIEAWMKLTGMTRVDDEFLKNWYDYTTNKYYRDWQLTKSRALDLLSIQCYQSFRRGYRNKYKTNKTLTCARDYYDAAVINKDELGYYKSQCIQTAPNLYEQVVVMAYWTMCTGGEPTDPAAIPWLKALVQTAYKGLSKDKQATFVFKVQTEDWRTGKVIPAEIIKAQAQALRDAGAINIGYYPAPVDEAKFDLSSI